MNIEEEYATGKFYRRSDNHIIFHERNEFKASAYAFAILFSNTQTNTDN